MCYRNCYYYPCIHMPGAYSYGYAPVWSTAEYTTYSPSSSTASSYSSVSSSSGRATAGASSYRRYATVAEEEERLRTLRRSRRSRNTYSDDDVYNVSVRYRGSSGRHSSSSSPTVPASLLPPTYYAFVPASSRHRVRVSLYD